jgi:hypothetical protein
MQDIYNDISSSDSDEEDIGISKVNPNNTKPQTPPKELSSEERQALQELYQDE